jgi:hypothetical protein
MTVSRAKPISHGWANAKEFPWLRQGFAFFGTGDIAVDQRHKVVWNYETGVGANRCHNNLDRPVEIHELRFGAVGSKVDEEGPAAINMVLPQLACRMGKTGQDLIDKWLPVEALTHSDKQHVYGFSAQTNDSMMFKLPTPFFLARGDGFKLELRTNSARYGGPEGCRGHVMLVGRNDDGSVGVLSSTAAAIAEAGNGTPFMFQNSDGGASDAHAQDMWVTHLVLAMHTGFNIGHEVDFSMYIEARFRPSSGPEWVASEDGWISMLGLATAPGYPVVICPLRSPLVLQPNEDFWVELMNYSPFSSTYVNTMGVLATVWAIGTQKGV